MGRVLNSAFKCNAMGAIGGIYQRMYHLFAANRDDYLRHYHHRSNNESLFSAVKLLFGDLVRSKNEVAMKIEVLGKLLAHNITCLVHGIYELGLGTEFGGTVGLSALQYKKEIAAPAVGNEVAMSKREVSQLPEPQRKDVFRALVEAQDGGMSVGESRRYVAERFGVTEIQVRQVEREGMDNDWPPL